MVSRPRRLGILANLKDLIPPALATYVATGPNPNQARAQAVVQANTTNPLEVRRRKTEKGRKYAAAGSPWGPR